jgi:Domain of unknown function (DUF4340)
MTFRHTLRWVVVAALLFGFILFQHRYLHKSSPPPMKVLPNLKAETVNRVQVRPAAGLEISALRANGTWQLTEPLVYPAQAVSIEKLLAELEQLMPAPYLPARELRGGPNTDEEYGFATPQAMITIDQPGYTSRLRVGAKTPPGDQVFVQVVGVDGVYVVDANFLRYIPRSADDWRDTALIDLNGLTYDRLAVTNGAKVFELRRDPATKLWRMNYPLQARANSARIEDSLQMLQNVRVQQFLPNERNANLESFGLQSPELEVALGQGTNTVARLQFGKVLTNDTELVYARRVGLNAVVAVPKELLAPWYASANDFRDPLLLNLTGPVAAIQVRGPNTNNFSVQMQTNGAWRVLPQGFPADVGLVRNLVTALSMLRIADFTNDVVTAQDLAAYGLASPARQYILKATNTVDVPTNGLLAELDFGTNQAGLVFTRRADESSVYLVKLADVQSLPMAGFQMRDRRIWSFSTNDVAGMTLREEGRVRHILRNGPHNWSLAGGSPGVIEDLAVEETVRGLCQLTAVAWLARGETNRARLGFTDKSRQITLELKNGDKASVEFGGQSVRGSPVAAVTLDKDLWIFEFPVWLYDYVQRYLSVPPSS